MPTKLEKLLARIDPAQTYDAVSIRADKAFNSFPMKKAQIEDRDEFEKTLGSFYHHIEKTVLNLEKGFPEYIEYHWVRCSNLITKALGVNGYHIAFEMARTGNEGGLYHLLKRISEMMAKEYAENQINYEVYHYWDYLTVEEKLAAPEEYLKNYGHLISHERTNEKHTRIKAFFWKALEEHPKVIQRVRRIGR